MPAGRPREYDRIQVGKDFVQYAKDHPDCLTVPMFCNTIGLDSGKFRTWAAEDEEFRTLFYIAKEQIGINRLKMTLSDSPVKLDCGIYKQTLTHYDQDSKAEVREEKQFEANIVKTDQLPEELTKGLDRFMSFLSATQQSDRKIEDKSINKEA